MAERDFQMIRTRLGHAGLAAVWLLAGATLAACGEEAPEPSNTDTPLTSTDVTGDADAPEDQPLLEDGTLARDTAQNTPPMPAGYASNAASLAPEAALATLAPSEGEWFMKEDMALFGPPESEAMFTLACEPGSGEIAMTRSLPLEPGETVRLGLYTDDASATGTWQEAGDVMPIAEASLDAGSDVFASMLEAGQFAVAAEGHAMLVMPVTDGVRDTIRACR